MIRSGQRERVDSNTFRSCCIAEQELGNCSGGVSKGQSSETSYFVKMNQRFFVLSRHHILYLLAVLHVRERSKIKAYAP